MVDKKTVEYVGKLARVKIDETQAQELKNQLSKIIDYIDKLKEIDVEGVEPMRGVHIQQNVFRTDSSKDSKLQEDILDNAPSREQNYFKIPKVIE